MVARPLSLLRVAACALVLVRTAAAQSGLLRGDSSAIGWVERTLAARDDSEPGMGWMRESSLRLEPNRHLLLRMRGLL
ncbi:MAG TPA: hypothetical protein VGA42_05520, partial [Gemmatimonadales bacterium]